MESISSKPTAATSSSSNSNGRKSNFSSKNGTNSNTSTNLQCTKSTEIVPPPKSLPATSSAIKSNLTTKKTKIEKLLETKKQPTLVKMQSKSNQANIVDDDGQFKSTRNPFIQLLSETTETEDNSRNITGRNRNGGNSSLNRLQISGDDGVEDDQNPFESNDTYDDSEDVIIRVIDDAAEENVNDNCESRRQECEDVDEGVIADMSSCTIESLPNNFHLNKTQLHDKLQKTPQNTTSCDKNVSSSIICHNNEIRISQNIEDKRNISSGDKDRDRDNTDIDADIDEDDDPIKIDAAKGISQTLPLLNVASGHCSLRRSLLQRNSICSNSSGSTGTGDNNEFSQNDLTNLPSNVTNIMTSTSIESRPIYPNVPYSPYGSPFGSPRSNRRRAPLRESRRISIEKSGSFLQLNQYKLMDQIGQGSYGLVKLAYSEEDSTHYAMKILSKRRLLRKAGLMGRGPKKTTSPLDRVYREIAVLKKLDHPNVVKLTEVLDDPLEDSLYLVFELVQQGEVLSIPTDKPLPEQRAWGVFRDALLGLEYLHYQRIIHADIKPGNLLLAECGRVKIADLGVCNEFLGEDAVMNNGSTAGTPAFRAPETLIPGQHIYSGKAADIWALGATLYSLVFGNVPFVASSVPVVYERIKNDPLNFPEKPIITNDLKDLIEKILTKDATKRITLPQIKQHPWVTSNGSLQLPTEEENCRLVQVSDEDINSVVKSIPKLDTLILIKTMLKNHSFQNPFMRGVSGRAPQPGGSRLERFSRSGRSNSAPGAYHLPPDRQLSSDSILPALSESAASPNNDSSDHDGI